MHMDPAKTIIEKVGGVEAVAEITGKHVTRVYRWMYPRERGGTGGVIPHSEARKILNFAKSEGVALQAEAFFEEAATDLVSLQEARP